MKVYLKSSPPVNSVRVRQGQQCPMSCACTAAAGPATQGVPLVLSWWNPESQLYHLSGRGESLSPWGITPADFLFLANEGTTLLLGVRELLLSHISDCTCVGPQQPTSLWKMAEMGCKNGRYPKSWNVSCSFSLWPIYWFKLSTWQIKLFVPLALCPLPSLGRTEALCWSCLSLCAGPAEVTLKSSSWKSEDPKKP